MGITVHLRAALLESVDRRARELGLSRNRYIIRVLERMLESETSWSRRFRAELEAASADEESRVALNELREALARSRWGLMSPRAVALVNVVVGIGIALTSLLGLAAALWW